MSRETVKCEHCHLTQYRSSADKCVRCGQSTAPPPPAPAKPPVETPAQPLPLTGTENLLIAMRITLKEGRIKRNLSQRELAARMKCRRTHISKFERGTVMPTLQTFAKFAAAMDVNLGSLLQIIDDRSAIYKLYAAGMKMKAEKKARR